MATRLPPDALAALQSMQAAQGNPELPPDGAIDTGAPVPTLPDPNDTSVPEGAVADDTDQNTVDPDAAVPLSPPKLDRASTEALASMLDGRFTQFKSDRMQAEDQWLRNMRQYKGIYDPGMILDNNRSKAYPKITRAKCVSMLSRLMNLLFPADDKNWSVAPSKVPLLSKEDLQTVLDGLRPPPQDPNAGMMAPGAMPPTPPSPLSDDDIEAAIRDFARKRGRRLELEIQDQLQEVGGDHGLDYVALCRKVLASGIQYGPGILHGPFVCKEKGRTWAMNADGTYTAQDEDVYRPRYEFVSMWDYYPDMSAKSLYQMDGQYRRIVMTRQQVNKLKSRTDFDADQVNEALKAVPNGNYKRMSYETVLRSEGPQNNSAKLETDKYEVIVWDGHVTARELKQAGCTIPDNQTEDSLRAQVWMLGGVVIKIQLDPWAALGVPDMRMYHHFIFEEDETFLMGNGLPNIMRDSQLGICAATRMMLDNGSIQRNLEINVSMLAAGQDLTTINPDKVWIRSDDDPAAWNANAVKVVDFPMRIAEMQGIVNMFQSFADSETFINPATGGDMQKGPSEPFRTAAGASMLRGDAALPFKDVVRNFDVFTRSVIGSLIIFNRKFNTNPDIQGDFQAVARGATSLIAKEVLGIQLDTLAQSMQPEERKYLKGRQLLIARLRVRDIDTEDVVMNDEEAAAQDATDAQNAQQASQLQTSQLQATIRDTLADALKNISQAAKNSANAEAVTTKATIDALDAGLAAAQGASDGKPDSGTPPSGQQGQSGSAGTSQAMPASGGNGINSLTQALSNGSGASAIPASAMPPGVPSGVPSQSAFAA